MFAAPKPRVALKAERSCSYNIICLGSDCSCYFCNRAGTICEGEATSECNEIVGCPWQQTLVVPNGDPVELQLVTDPPLSGSTRTTVTSSCSTG
jgi:hypothetical protein